MLMGVAAIIRNARGEVIATLAKKLDGLFTPKNVEAKALGLSFLGAIDGLNLQPLESDALTLLQALNNGVFGHSKLLMYFVNQIWLHIV